jgi:hypothetical protein
MNDMETLPRLIDQAMAALDNATTAAEVLDARDRAKVAYDAAKSAARFAKAKSAHATILATCHRMQADALTIEARAQSRLADEYSAAQERGEVAKQSDGAAIRDHVPGENKVATVTDIGLTRKQIHEARQVRDAENREPAVIKNALDVMLEAGEEPTRASVRRLVKETNANGQHDHHDDAVNAAIPPSKRKPHTIATLKAKLVETHRERKQAREIIQELMHDNSVLRFERDWRRKRDDPDGQDHPPVDYKPQRGITPNALLPNALFLIQTSEALSWAVFKGKIDERSLTSARATASAWSRLVKNMESTATKSGVGSAQNEPQIDPATLSVSVQDEIAPPEVLAENILYAIGGVNENARIFNKLLKVSVLDREAVTRINTAIDGMIKKWRSIQSTLERVLSEG